ncbi:MAG: DMT family transporter [Chloroflexi bacterium]|nr:DMT family transporter [Chloroflexota bacterium]
MIHSRRRQLWADLLLLLVTLIWGSTFTMVKNAVSDYPVLPFLALRFALATLALLPLGWRRLRSLGWRGWGAGALIGLFLFAGYALQTMGLQYTSASKAGFITGLSVVIVPILSTVVLRPAQRPNASSILGVLLATVGLALLSLTQELNITRGDLLVLFCAFSFALHIVSISAFAPRHDPIALTIVQVATVTLASGTSSLFTLEGWPLPRPSTWFAAAFTGVLATALAFGLQTAVQRFTTPTHTALIFAAEPVFAALFGVLLAGDVLTVRHLVGGALIVIGTIVSEIRWSERTARLISRFLAPQYIGPPWLLILALTDNDSWPESIAWAVGIGLVSIALPLLLMLRELRVGRISDWHISERSERLQPVPILVGMLATGMPLGILILFDGPRTLMLGFAVAFGLALFNLAITFWWKISQHVSTVAAATTLITGLLGLGAAPSLLLIPLVAWARVKVGAHTVMQTVAGGLAGVTFSLLVLYLYRLTTIS